MSIHRKREIIDFVVANRVITTSELAVFLGVSWNTAEKRLLELALDGKLLRLKKQGVNLWLVK